MELGFLHGRDRLGDAAAVRALTTVPERRIALRPAGLRRLDSRDATQAGVGYVPDDVISPPESQAVQAESTAAPTQRMRARLARIGRAQSGDPVLEPLFKVVRATHPKADLALVEQAYRTAERHHRGQTRNSGDPYITHPLAVTSILAELGMTPPTLCAALLHDTVEDTSYTLAQLTADFGDEVALLVDGLTKLDKVKYGDSAKAETIRKMVVAMSKDIRVLVIKLADRLHNMRTLRFLRIDKQERIANETLQIYAPLAHRLGMNTIKWELEDLAFATLHPKVYDEIVRLVAERAPARDEFLATVIDEVQEDLRGGQDQGDRDRPAEALLLDLPEDDRARPRLHRHLRPGRASGCSPSRVRDCYAVLGVLHARWNPVPGPVQGLHRDAEVQHVPVAAHDGDRTRRQAGRAADPHLRHAPPGRVRRRRALEVQGGQRQRRRHRPHPGQRRLRQRRHGLGPPADGLAEGDPGPERVPRLAAVRDQLGRGLRLHAARRGRSRCPSARRRSTSPTPSTPRWATTASARGSTAGWSRSSPRSTTATSSRCSPRSRRTPDPAATG